MVGPFPHQADQEISIYTFVVMKWNQVEIVKTQKGCDQEYHRTGDEPGSFRDHGFRRRFERLP
jgi:hypothetical protein